MSAFVDAEDVLHVPAGLLQVTLGEPVRPVRLELDVHAVLWQAHHMHVTPDGATELLNRTVLGHRRQRLFMLRLKPAVGLVDPDVTWSIHVGRAELATAQLMVAVGRADVGEHLVDSIVGVLRVLRVLNVVSKCSEVEMSWERPHGVLDDAIWLAWRLAADHYSAEAVLGEDLADLAHQAEVALAEWKAAAMSVRLITGTIDVHSLADQDGELG